MSVSESFVAGLPKAELHVHHVGSASPRIVSALAERHPGTVPSDPGELREFYTFRDFGHFIEVYLAVVDQARARGLHSIPHAGETTGPGTVWDALRQLGAERIGHGTSSTQDPALLAHVVEHRIPIEVCPTSNLATRAVARLEDHPVKEMYAAGAVVTINSDDPPMFGTTLTREYELAAELFELDEDGVAELARTAVRSSFLDETGKAALLREIDHYAAGSGTP